MEMMDSLEQTILWRRLDAAGHDACGLWTLSDGWRLTGSSVFCLNGEPCHLDYSVNCDTLWRTRSATVTGWIDRDSVDLMITVLPGERWSLNGSEQTDVAGCVDLDLGFTPATNLIPLRRLALAIGDKADAAAAWLRFPGLALERLEQHYHRLAHDRYDYQAPTVGFAASLDVGDIGFITRYPGLWEKEP